METPRTMFVSALKVEKPSTPRLRETRATWELSIAWSEMPMIGVFRAEQMLTSRTNVNVDISDDILDGFNNLLEDDSFCQFGLKHFLISSRNLDYNFKIAVVLSVPL